MSKKLLIMLTVALMGLFVASSVMAYDLGDIANRFKPGGGHTAGTIINPEGEGDALIFPYYDVRQYGTGVNVKEQDTYFCIINSDIKATSGGVAAKIRFREWDKSMEVFDAEIWLSKGDVWCASISRNTISGYAKITSSDYVITGYSSTSCGTDQTFTLSTPLASGFDFFCPTGYPSISSNLMGYFEVIGSERTADKAYGTTTIKVTRLATGYCDAPNTLAGYAYIVRVADGVAAGYKATAFANFHTSGLGLFTGTGTLSPDLSTAEDTLDQIEFLLSKYYVYAGYSVEDIIGGKFSLIMTFPTKHFHFDSKPYWSIKASPLGKPWTVAHMNGLETISLKICDRNENCLTGGWWSPPGASAGLPYEVSILGLYVSTPPTVPAAGIRDNVAATTSGYQAGWVAVDFTNIPNPWPPKGKLTYYGWFDLEFTCYTGLPVIGLAMQEFQNGAVGGWYGEILPAFYRVHWDPLIPQIPLQ